MKQSRTLTNERLMSTAATLFYQRGVQAVGVDEIAAEAGVTKMTLYRHFASKDALVAACLEAASQDEVAVFDMIAERLAGDPAGQLRAILVEAAARIAAPNYRGWSSTNIVMELTDAMHPARRIAATAKSAARERLLALAAAAGARNPRSLADGLLMLVEGAAASRQAFLEDGPASCLVEVGEDLLALHGLARVNGRGRAKAAPRQANRPGE